MKQFIKYIGTSKIANITTLNKYTQKQKLINNIPELFR